MIGERAEVQFYYIFWSSMDIQIDYFITKVILFEILIYLSCFFGWMKLSYSQKERKRDGGNTWQRYESIGLASHFGLSLVHSGHRSHFSNSLTSYLKREKHHNYLHKEKNKTKKKSLHFRNFRLYNTWWKIRNSEGINAINSTSLGIRVFGITLPKPNEGKNKHMSQEWEIARRKDFLQQWFYIST